MDILPPELDQLLAETGLLLSYARARLHDHHEAEEAVQDCLLVAWRQRKEFSGQSSLRTWLVGILRHKVLDRLRARRRRPDRPNPQAPDPYAESASGDDRSDGGPGFDDWFDARGAWRIDPSFAMEPLANCPRDSTQRAELRSFLHLCLDALPDTLRRLFALRELDQLDTREAATLAGVSVGSAPVLLTRARLRLRDCLQRRLATQ